MKKIFVLLIALTALTALTACSGGADDGGGTADDSGMREDGGVLRADDASFGLPDSGMMPPRPDGGMMPPPPDGGMMMMGPRPCMETSDCAGACPPGSVGCVCDQTPMGKLCVPTCTQDSDCPMGPPGAPMLRCDTGRMICVPL